VLPSSYVSHGQPIIEPESDIKSKAIPVTGHEGPEGCEMSRLPLFLDTRLTDGGEVVSPKLRPLFTSRKIPGISVRG
jgi:hypothetical protein